MPKLVETDSESGEVIVLGLPQVETLWNIISDPECDFLRSDPLHHEVLTLVALLHQSNRSQWDAEDIARAAGSDAELANAKRTIDTCNAVRVQLIERINTEFARLIPPSDSVPPLTSQPGVTCDQLSVLKIRLEVAISESGSHIDEQRLNEVQKTVDGLIAALEADLADALAGRRTFSATPVHKIYGKQ